MDLQEFKIPFNPLSKLTCSDVLDFQDYPILSLETNEAGCNFISYLVAYLNSDTEQRIVMPVSEFRLHRIRMGQMSIKNAFDSVEGGVVYGIHIHRGTGEVREAFLIPSQRFQKINPVASDYFIHAPPEVAISMGDSAAAALAVARDRHRVLLDLYLQGSELGAGRPWYP